MSNWLIDVCQKNNINPSDCKVTPVSGGDINTSFQISCRDQSWFIKTNDHAYAKDMFYQETVSLDALRAVGRFCVPKTHGLEMVEGTAYLLMDFIPLTQVPLRAEFATALAALHKTTSPHYGWSGNNYIGYSQQKNKRHRRWSSFWWENRVLPQLAHCEQQNLHIFAKQLKKLDYINSQLLEHHQPQASLLHGDLWSGNAALNQNGIPCIYDPASYFGDRETDLALTELFGGFHPDFYQAYRSCHPLDSGYTLRKDWYNLYHLMNHAILFGGHYVESCLKTIDQLYTQLS